MIVKTDSQKYQPAHPESELRGRSAGSFRFITAVLVPAAFLFGCSNTEDGQRIAQLEEQIVELSADRSTDELSPGAAPDPAPPLQAGSPQPVELDYSKQYIDWVSPSNCAIARGAEEEAAIIGADGTFYEEEWGEVGPMLNVVHDRVASSLISALNEASTLTWPAEIQESVDAVIAEMAELAALYSGFAQASTFAEWSVATQRASGFTGRSSAALLRTKLGLPSNIGDESDYC